MLTYHSCVTENTCLREKRRSSICFGHGRDKGKRLPAQAACGQLAEEAAFTFESDPFAQDEFSSFLKMQTMMPAYSFLSSYIVNKARKIF